MCAARAAGDDNLLVDKQTTLYAQCTQDVGPKNQLSATVDNYCETTTRYYTRNTRAASSYGRAGKQHPYRTEYHNTHRRPKHAT